MPAGRPVSRIATRSARSLVSAAEVREHAGVEDRQQAGQLGLGRRTAGSRCRRFGSVPFHSSLRASGTSTSLNSGLPSRDTCTYGPTPTDAPLSRSVALRRDADAHTPIVAFVASGSVGALPLAVTLPIGSWMAIVCTLNERSAFTPGRRRRRDQVQVLERPQRGEVEDRAEVDVEAVEALPGEDLDPVADVVDRRVGQRRVVRRRADPDVARRQGAGRRRGVGGARCAPRAPSSIWRRLKFGLSRRSIGPVL